MSMLSFKQFESNYGKKEPCKQVVRLLNFLTVWIWDIVNMVLLFQFKLKMAVHPAFMKKTICELSNFWWIF